MSKNASRRASPSRDTINHSSYGKTAPVQVTRDSSPRFIPATQNAADRTIEPVTECRPGYRELTNELRIDDDGVIYLTEAGMRNLEAGLRRRNAPPERISDYFNCYFGIREQLERCRDLFK